MSIIKHVTLQKIVAHDFRYGPRILTFANRESFKNGIETFLKSAVERSDASVSLRKAWSFMKRKRKAN